MLVENTKQNKTVQQVASTMAIENMPLSTFFINELLKVVNGEKLLTNYAKRRYKNILLKAGNNSLFAFTTLTSMYKPFYNKCVYY